MSNWDAWKSRLKPVLDSKTDEFRLIGYQEATNDGIWNCLMDHVWKGQLPEHLHEATADIFHLSTRVFMNHLTMKVYQDDDLMASIQALSTDSQIASKEDSVELHNA